MAIFEINNFVCLSDSNIHSKGLFALKNIPAGTKLIQYKGELISKEEGTRRSDASFQKAQQDSSKGATYIFELDENNDIDGDIEENYAKYINHSCDPNCQYKIEKKEIWICSIKDIPKGEEITFDYGFDFDPKDVLDHQCKCKSKNCIGYIVAKKDIKKLIEYLKNNNISH